MGRKRNQGKARRAAKAAKAAEEAERRGGDNQTTNSSRHPLAAQMRQLHAVAVCKHGCDPPPSPDDSLAQFMSEFYSAFVEAVKRCGGGSLSMCLFDATNATLADVGSICRDVERFCQVGKYDAILFVYWNARSSRR